ncbi:MAG: GTP-binding protein [Actinophytocola sp.]|nr:GTP-binding protein [Actinophytocola sp.]
MSTPVVIVTGFLGSGKTTLLNHLLHNDDGVRIGVIVNDFGSVNIDAMLVAGQVDAMVTLDNGCLCCAVDASGMDAMLTKLTQSDSDIDIVVIEASGLAEPRDLLRLVLASEEADIVPGGLVEVVDAAEFEATSAEYPQLDQHLTVADLVVLNKIDRVDADVRDRLVTTVGKLSDGAPVVPTSHGAIDPRLLFDPPEHPRQDDGQLSFDELLREDFGTDCSAHLHAAFESVDFRTEEPLDPRQLMALLSDRPAGVYRVKGCVHFGVPGHGQKFWVHAVGGFTQVRRDDWQRDEQPHTQLVVIGASVDGSEVLARLRACEVGGSCALDEQSMLGVLRYVDA